MEQLAHRGEGQPADRRESSLSTLLQFVVVSVALFVALAALLAASLYFLASSARP